jgi:hypothetical protein
MPVRFFHFFSIDPIFPRQNPNPDKPELKIFNLYKTVNTFQYNFFAKNAQK